MVALIGGVCILLLGVIWLRPPTALFAYLRTYRRNATRTEAEVKRLMRLEGIYAFVIGLILLGIWLT